MIPDVSAALTHYLRHLNDYDGNCAHCRRRTRRYLDKHFPGPARR